MITVTGSPRDLVERAEGRPIYCTTSPMVSPALAGAVVASLRRRYPESSFINARKLYRNRDDRWRRWDRERDQYGAAIILTRAGELPDGNDPFGGLAGEHAIGIWAAIELQYFVHAGRPAGWHAFVHPASYWQSRFAVLPFEWMSNVRYAGLVPPRKPTHFAPS